MQRIFIEELDKWAKSPFRKPLCLSGARQVGKTWLLKEFGRTRFKKLAYVNFDRNSPLKSLFAGRFDLKKILTGLQIESGVVITPGDTLIVLDEIQDCADALTSLKYWEEEASDYVVAAAGSLVGLSLLEGTGYPVGKTDSLTLYPMTFREFLLAVGEKMLAEALTSHNHGVETAFSEKFTYWLKLYYLIGGMPRAVAAYAATASVAETRKIQQGILTDFARDFAKHAPKTQLPRIQAIWRSLPAQLAKEDKRFVAAEVEVQKDVKTRARDLRDPFEWLEATGLVYRVWNVTKPGLPLAAYQNHIFKLFGLDVGLLSAQSGLEARTVLEGTRVFTEFKGALTEQFVQQELRAEWQTTPYTWTPSDSQSEVDFLVQSEGAVIPIEAKAECNLRAKSLAIYRGKFKPERAIRTSLASRKSEVGLDDVPLYALGAEFAYSIRSAMA
ncbi:MAG: ATP-binding protein [Kiritimatiellia bacterium]